MAHILIVDDEKNIRLTLAQAIASLPITVDTADDGEQALDRIRGNDYSLILLDLRMPGIDGMEVLRRLRNERPEIPVIIITAHGNVESAVEAMKLGAIEFLQKPFVPNDIRGLVTRVLDRHRLSESEAQDYATWFELAKRCISERHFNAAINHLKRAIGVDPKRPEAFNLLGAIHELIGEHSEAMNNYRVAYHTDPSYQPAQENLHRAGSMSGHMRPIVLGSIREQPLPNPD